MEISKGLTFLMALACGAVVANLYYAQPLIASIGPDIALPPEVSSLVVTLSQLGYGVGLVLLVPMGDLCENRRLIALTLLATALALVGAGAATTAELFLLAAAVIGLSSVVVQMLVPFAAHLTPERTQGRTVGYLMSGLMAGILLARPASILVAEWAGWRTVFFLSAALMLILALTFRLVLPQRRPAGVMSYRGMLRSMASLLLSTPVLQRRGFYHACLFGAFSLYWTAVPLILASPAIGMRQRDIALFTLAALTGALVAPLAGRIADKGWTRPATGVAIIAVAGAFLLMLLGGGESAGMLFVAALFLDLGVACNVVLGHRAIFALGSETRNRLNGLYIALFFCGGACGSAAAGLAFTRGGGESVAWSGMAFAVLAGMAYVTEFGWGRRLFGRTSAPG